VTSALPISHRARLIALASRVYYGHGYCIEQPEAFRAGGGGHDLATSHVGFEFDNGMALLVAADTPVDHLEVNPPTRSTRCTPIQIPPTLLSPEQRCSRVRHPLPSALRQSTGARSRLKAGRYVFDLWGGRYAEDAARLERCFDYGLTNALVIMHVWQRWATITGCLTSSRRCLAGHARELRDWAVSAVSGVSLGIAR